MTITNLPQERYYIYLSSPTDNTIKISSPNGTFLGSIDAGSSGLAGPDGLAIGVDHNLYVGTVVGGNVLKFNPLTGAYLGEFVSRNDFVNAASNDFNKNLGTATGITFGPDGNLYVSNFESRTGISVLGQPIINYDIQDSVLVFDGKTGTHIKTIEIPYDNAGNVGFEGTISAFNELRKQQGLPYQGTVTKASLPIGLKFGVDGDLYIATRLHDTVYRYDPESGNISPFMTDLSGLDGAADVYQDSYDSWYVTSLDNNKILRYDANGNFLGAFDYTNQASSFDGPTGITATPDEQFLIATGYNTTNLAQIDATTGDINTILAQPSPDWGFFRNDGVLVATPEMLGVSKGNNTDEKPPIVKDENTAKVTQVDTPKVAKIDDRTDNSNAIADSISNGPAVFRTATSGFLVSSVANDRPGAVVNINVDPKTGKIISATPNFTPGNSTIIQYDQNNGNYLKTLVKKGVISLSSGITMGPDGLLYANDQGYAYTPPGSTQTVYGRILRFAPLTGELINDNNGQGFIPASVLTAHGLLFPEDLRFDANGDIYVSGLGGGGVQKFGGKTGAYKATVASTNSQGQELIAAGLNFGPDNNLYISSVLNDSSILKYETLTGLVSTFIPPSIAEPIPSGSTFTPDGQQFLNGTFFDPSGAPVNIRQYSSTGLGLGYFVEPSNNGGLQSASRMIYGKNKDLYISDFAGSQVMRYNGSTGVPLGAFVPNNPSVNGDLINPGGLAFSTTEKLGDLTYDLNGSLANGEVKTQADQDALSQTQASFNNLVGLYQVQNADGAILDSLDSNGNGQKTDLLNPGDAGYARTAISNAVSNFILQMGGSGGTSAAEFGNVILQGGARYAPFVIANGGNLITGGGTLQDGITAFLSQNPNNTGANLTDFRTHAVAYFTFGMANPDGTQHLQNRGNDSFGFEDLPGNLGVSDFDFNDSVFKFIFSG